MTPSRLLSPGFSRPRLVWLSMPSYGSLLLLLSAAVLMMGLTTACGSESAADSAVPPAASASDVPVSTAPSEPASSHAMSSRRTPPPDSPIPASQSTEAAAPTGSIARASVTDYVPYTAPENAFVMEVPAGWQVETYIDRGNPNGTIPWMGMASPDGQIVIRAPDAPGAAFMLPNAYVGRYEGQRAGLFPVRQIVSASQYAAEHAHRVAQALGCQDARLVDQEPRADLAAKTRSAMPQGVQTTVTEVTAAFARLDCRRQGAALTIQAGATLILMQPVEGWMATTSSVIAPTPRTEEAERVMAHMNRTMNPSRTWIEREYREGQRRAAEASRAAWAARARERQTTASSSTSSLGSTTGESDDAGHRSFIHSIHGTQDLTDRHGDTVYGVTSSSSYHWQDIHGTIVGTDINDNPDPLRYERMTPANQ